MGRWCRAGGQENDGVAHRSRQQAQSHRLCRYRRLVVGPPLKSCLGGSILTTSGGPPPAFTQYVYDVANDALVGWSASPRIAGGDTVPGTTRETWLLPLSTLTWTKAANVASGRSSSLLTPYMSVMRWSTIRYEIKRYCTPERAQAIILLRLGLIDIPPRPFRRRRQHRSPPPPPPPPPTTSGPVPTYTGAITSFPLPALVGAPYSTLQNSKHTNMAYSPVTNRLYVEGGDWVTSATDGTWSMSLVDGSWRQDVGAPVYPTLPAPHAAQDEMGFVWDASRQKFLLLARRSTTRTSRRARPSSSMPRGCGISIL